MANCSCLFSAAVPALLLQLLLFPSISFSKSTIEPCSGADTCSALVGYTLYTDLKLSELSSLFNADPISILAANSIDFTAADVINHIFPSGIFLRIPVVCSCVDGIRKSVLVKYKTRPADTLASIAGSVYAGLVSADQVREANNLPDPVALDAGQVLNVPLPCTCFNNTDNNTPAVYLSYVVVDGDTVADIANRYETTVTDIMNVNAMGTPAVKPGDIIAIPLPGCWSMLPRFASDFGLIVANGSYAITASHCVQCSCGPGNLNLYCKPAPLAASCSSMQCANSNLMLGNVTSQLTSAGCNVTSCTYGGFVNGTILTTLSSSLQPQCPGQHQFPPLVLPPSTLPHEDIDAPAPSPVPHPSSGTDITPRSPLSGGFSLPGVSPASGPAGSVSAAPTHSRLNYFHYTLVFYLVKFML